MSSSEATLRNGGSRPRASSPSSPSSIPSPLAPQSASGTTAALFASHKSWLLALYPLILALGSFTSLISPSLRSTPYDYVTQSHPPHLAPSYFARKSNVFNIYFVKIAWAWYTGVFFMLILLRLGNSFASHESRQSPSKPIAQALARYAVVTAWWCAVTQWFFGPPIIDRSFRFSGGRCEIRVVDESTASVDRTADIPTLVTAAACKLAGGAWKGGHDISGHVFLLVLGSAFLYLEGAPTFFANFLYRQEHRQTSRKEGMDSDIDITRISPTDGLQSSVVLWLSIGVVGLSWWMLLMTATYFHTWFEKVCGVMSSFIGLHRDR